MNVSIKLEGITSFQQMSKEVRQNVIAGGARVMKKHCPAIQTTVKSKIKNRTGEMASLIKYEVAQGEHYAVGNIGTIGASAADAKKFTAYEYGHAAPNNAGGVKIVPGSAVLRSSLDADKGTFKRDMETEIKSVVERR